MFKKHFSQNDNHKYTKRKSSINQLFQPRRSDIIKIDLILVCSTPYKKRRVEVAMDGQNPDTIYKWSDQESTPDTGHSLDNS